MNPLAVLALWISYGLLPGGAAPAPVGNPNLVRVCPAVSGSGPAPCQEIDARRLDPSGWPAGQVAFVDPETKALVQPTEEQLEELSLVLAIEESMAKRQDVTVQTLPDGTLKLGPGSSFAVVRKAVLEEKKEEKP